jgi:RNase adapter protein RapZ
MRIIVVTGMSGSGKSTAVRVLEDEGFSCIDNLPVTLFPKFIELIGKSREQVSGVVLVMDIRSLDFISGYTATFEEIRTLGHSIELFFCDATDEILIRRFSETRRRHPAAGFQSVPDAVRFEREQLAGLHRLADKIFDTSETNVHQLREQVLAHVRGCAESSEMTVHLQSFGYRYGLPLESDMVFDVRFLPNPHFVPELKRFTGLHPAVRDYVLEKQSTMTFITRVEELLEFLTPRFRSEGKSYLTISVGCTGGKHRSVAVTEGLARLFSSLNVRLKITHRDMEKGNT